MTSGAPWSVKGINPRAREIAKDLARRDGMTLGEWINRLILEDTEASDVPSPQPASAEPEPMQAAAGPKVFESPRPQPGSPARFEAAGHPADEVGRVASALDALSDRIEAAERRSTSAIAGIDGSVRNALERLGESEREHVQVAARFEGLADDIKVDQARAGERMRKLETLVEGQRSSEAVRELEGALGKLANRLYEEEARTGDGLADLVRRVEEQEAREPIDPEALVEAVVQKLGQRLETAQAGTSDALRDLASSFTVLDRRLRTVEGQAGPDLEQRFSRLSLDLAQRLETSRLEMAAKLRDVADGRFDRMEGKLAEMAGHVQAAEQRSAHAMERMGREMVGLTDNLNRRVQESEARSAHSMEQIAAAMEHRVGRADGVQAQALEKLGAEIARITERLAERIANAERRNALAIDDVGEQVAKVTERLDQRHERGSADLAERIRLSEERTAKLLDEAREKIDSSLSRRFAAQPPVAPQPAYQPAAEPEPVQSFSGFSAVFGGSHEAAEHAALSAQQPEPFVAAAFPSARTTAPAEAFDETAFEPAERFDPVDEFEPEAPAAEAAETSQAPEAADAFEAPAAFEAVEAFETPQVETPEAAPAAEFDEEPEAAHVAENEEEEVYSAPEAFDVHIEPQNVVAPTPAPPLSTREVIEQARAAARAASANEGRGRKAPRVAPAPASTDAPAPRSLFGGFGLRQKKQAGSTLKTMLTFSGLAAFVGASLAAYYLGVAEPGGGTAPRVQQARNAAAPPTAHGATAAPATVNAAVALTPMPQAGAPAAPTSQARIAAAAPVAAGPDPAMLYGDAVRKIEAKDAGGLDSLRKVANQGYAPAQFYLAKLYENGEAGLKKDPAEARRWTERAAQMGDRKAMHNLGLYYFEGQGGPKNSTLAAQWFRRAADLGLVDSQYNLARLYEEGLGVSQNAAEAYKWYLIAGKNGDGDSAKSASRIKGQLTAEAQGAAERSAIGFRPATANASQMAVGAAPGGAASVTTAQKALSKLGYYQGPQDGTPSPALKLAVAAYQRDQGVPATGAIDADVLNRLQVFAR